MKTHYDSLKIARNAPAEVIRAAYRALAQRYHPDRNPDDVNEAARIMKIINSAYETLSDPARRRAYDDSLESQENQGKVDSSGFGETKDPPGYTTDKNTSRTNRPMPTGSTGTSFRGRTIRRRLARIAMSLLVVTAIGAAIRLPAVLSRIPTSPSNSTSSWKAADVKSDTAAATPSAPTKIDTPGAVLIETSSDCKGALLAARDFTTTYGIVGANYDLTIEEDKSRRGGQYPANAKIVDEIAAWVSAYGDELQIVTDNQWHEAELLCQYDTEHGRPYALLAYQRTTSNRAR